MDLNSFLKVNQQPRPVKRGDLLLSEPLLKGPFFDRSVILVLDAADDKSGVMGLVLNKSTNFYLNDIIQDWDKAAHIPVFCGGPVETDRLFMLHSLGDVLTGAVEILPGLCVGGDINDLVEYINDGGQTEGKMRFFVGYSGWGTEQLMNEMAENVWTLAEPIPGKEILRGADNAFWRREVERLGSKYRSWLVVPHNPSMN